MEVLLTPKYFFPKIIFAPVQNGCEQKMLMFSQALKPIKWVTICWKKEKIAAMRFSGTKIKGGHIIQQDL